MKFSINILTAVVLFIATTTTALAQTAPSETATTALQQIQEATPVKTVETKVKGVTCADDVKTITRTVENIKGITSCVGTKKGPTTTFEITYNPSITTLDNIHKVIEATSGCKDPNDRPYKVKS
jgi:copper chaperone CopZ